MRRLVPSFGLRDLTKKQIIERLSLDHYGFLDRRSGEQGGVVVVEPTRSRQADGVGNQHGVRGTYAGVALHCDSRVLGINDALVHGGAAAAVVGASPGSRVSIVEEQQPAVGSRRASGQTYGATPTDLRPAVTVCNTLP